MQNEAIRIESLAGLVASIEKKFKNMDACFEQAAKEVRN